jgi:hypothetical protein
MIRRTILTLASMVLLAGCPRQALFVVLPNAEGGGTGAITVDDGKTMTTLDQPYAAAESRAGSSAPVEESREDIAAIFERAVAAQPILPHHFRLYFILGSNELTPESEFAYRAVFDDIKQRPAYEIEVIGFTDTLGDPPYNQALSLARAAALCQEGARAPCCTRDEGDPSEPSCRGRLQTAMSCFGQKLR